MLKTLEMLGMPKSNYPWFFSSKELHRTILSVGENEHQAVEYEKVDITHINK